jgi:hypothetical protein
MTRNDSKSLLLKKLKMLKVILLKAQSLLLKVILLKAQSLKVGPAVFTPAC